MAVASHATMPARNARMHCARATLQVEKNTTLVFSGFDKVILGDFCATVRRQRPPEPYKGKGIRYAGEVIKLKEGKGEHARTPAHMPHATAAVPCRSLQPLHTCT